MIKILEEHISFQNENDYMDVEVHHNENWIELKIETSSSFVIESQEDLDIIYNKLTQIISSFKTESKSTESKPVDSSSYKIYGFR